jgi:hypothetical protein
LSFSGLNLEKVVFVRYLRSLNFPRFSH